MSFPNDQSNPAGAIPVYVVSGGGGGGGSAGYSISDLIVQDSTNAQGIRRETVGPTGTVSFVYENFDGTAWVPTPPMVAVAIAPNAGVATETTQLLVKTAAQSIDTKTPDLVGGAVPVSGAFFQATQPVSAAALPLPAGASTSAAQTTGNASLSSIDGKIPALSGGAMPVTGPITNAQFIAAQNAQGLTDTQLRASAVPVTIASNLISALPVEATAALPVTQAPQRTWRSGFDAIVASGPDTAFFTAIANGAGIAVSQSAGSLVITTGTTAYSETILRSTQSWMGAWKSRYSVTLSQRIVNCEVYLELVDVIGDGLTIVHNSATSVTVTIPSNPFTASNVGQGVFIGAISVASSLNQRATIASISGNDVTFTGAGFAATGTGTCSLFGWNFHHAYYQGTTATSNFYGTQRNGWTAGDSATTINTTATGHIGVLTTDAAKAAYFDQLSASSTTVELTQRASSVRNVPEDQTVLRWQIRVRNLATAPASTTTVTVGFVEMDSFVPQQVSLIGVEAQSVNQALGVQLVGSSGVLGTVSNLSLLSSGQTAHSAASTGSPIRIGGRVNTAVDTTLVAGDACDAFMSSSGQLIQKPYADGAVDWQASSGLTALATTTSTQLKAAGAAGVRNYVTALQLYNTSATVSTTVTILDGSTVIWAGFLPATTASLPVVDLEVNFPTPLRGTAATAMNIQLGTTSANVYYNAQGFQGV